MDLPNDLTSFLLSNNTPLEDFSGLTPTEMHFLLYDTFEEDSPVQLRSDIDDATLDQIPLFRIAEGFLKIIERDKFIKLTPNGALPQKVLVELYEQKFLPDEFIESGIVKLHREHDCLSIRSARLAVGFARFVKKLHGRLSLTQKGTKILQAKNRVQFFRIFLASFTNQFNWSYNDAYPDLPIGQLGWAFTVYLLAKFGDCPRTIGFYADKYLKAFPDFIDYFPPFYYTTPQIQFQHCYGVRTFERFLDWFGFVTIEKQKPYFDMDNCKITRTDLLHKIFTFKPNVFEF